MNLRLTIAFTVFPYIALTMFVVGHAYRYVTDMRAWNVRSTAFLEKDQHFPAITLFHWGILGTLFGHAGGLLIPQRVFDAVGIHADAHMTIAYLSGLLVGHMALIGSLWLIGRRLAFPRLRANTTAGDWVTLSAIVVVSGAGTYNVMFGHFDVLTTVAPWIRGIVTLHPEPLLMAVVPPTYKIHILLALALLAYSPFSRLVHIWSAPVFYVLRPPILVRKHARGPAARPAE